MAEAGRNFSVGAPVGVAYLAMWFAARHEIARLAAQAYVALELLR